MVRTARLLGFLLPVVITACGASDADTSTSPPPPDLPDASAGTSLTFEPNGIIKLAPGQSQEVHVAVQPPEVHVVRFALLDEFLDASLDKDERLTGPDGTTSVVLTAPGSATTFRLRASAGENAVAEIPVSVSGEGFASLHVFPSYAGIRSTPTWTASAITRSLCTDLPGALPPDGPIVGMGIGGAPAILTDLPVGPNIAVTLRSAHAVSGCMDISDLTTGEKRDVTIKVSDMPVDVGATDLLFIMEMTPDGESAWPLFESLLDVFADDVFPPDKSEAGHILDGMADHVSDASEFSSARVMGGWDALLATRLDDGGELLSDLTRAWIREGLAPMRQGKTLSGRLAAAAAGTGRGTLTIDSFQGLSPSAAGIASDHDVSLEVEPGDVMIVGGSVSWMPSRLIAAAADEGVNTLLGAQVTSVSALSEAVGCSTLAEELEATYPLPSSCEASCIEDACNAALADLWDEATLTSASTFETVQLSFTVSGAADVNGEAVVVAWDASWVGTQTFDEAEASLKGSAVASVEAPQSR